MKIKNTFSKKPMLELSMNHYRNYIDGFGKMNEEIQDMTGLLVPVDNVAALSEALLDLIKHPEKRKRMGTAGRQKAIHEFLQESVCEKTLAIYDELFSKYPLTGKE